MKSSSEHYPLYRQSTLSTYMYQTLLYTFSKYPLQFAVFLDFEIYLNAKERDAGQTQVTSAGCEVDNFNKGVLSTRAPNNKTSLEVYSTS